MHAIRPAATTPSPTAPSAVRLHRADKDGVGLDTTRLQHLRQALAAGGYRADAERIASRMLAHAPTRAAIGLSQPAPGR